MNNEERSWRKVLFFAHVYPGSLPTAPACDAALTEHVSTNMCLGIRGWVGAGITVHQSIFASFTDGGDGSARAHCTAHSTALAR